MNEDLAARVRGWIADDPDQGDRAELEALLARAGGGDVDAGADLDDRFAAELTFGTAGLRGAVGAGPNRINRAVVRRASAAVGAYLLRQNGGNAARGVVIGCDARHRSSELADEAALVLTGAGLRVHLLPRPRPTPLTAFAVTHLHAAAAIMITASHNPREDNGYKLYLGDGAQIIPPVDEEIEALMLEVGALAEVPLGSLEDDELVVHHDEEVVDEYIAAIVAASPRRTGADRELRVVYTPLHGVAGTTFLKTLAHAGHPAPYVVPEQAEPDPEFPTAPYPNPEVPGALDLAIAAAHARNADLVIANDPDGDRLAVAVPDPTAGTGWRRLSGDQLGWILGEYLLAQSDSSPEADRRVVATTIVSSRLLTSLAATHAVRYIETLTGFKWIARSVDGLPGMWLLFGYEEALGYAVGGVVRDKDGIGAALAFLNLAAETVSRGASLLEFLDEIETPHGVHLTHQTTVPTHDAGAVMTHLRAAPPKDFAGIAVTESQDLSDAVVASGRGLPTSDVLVYFLEEQSRIVVRPSGTEPKVKAYIEVIEPVQVVENDLASARAAAAERMEHLLGTVNVLLG